MDLLRNARLMGLGGMLLRVLRELANITASQLSL